MIDPSALEKIADSDTFKLIKEFLYQDCLLWFVEERRDRVLRSPRLGYFCPVVKSERGNYAGRQ